MRASRMSGPRYQLWQPVSQKGTYLVDETYRAQTSDPLCSGKYFGKMQPNPPSSESPM